MNIKRYVLLASITLLSILIAIWINGKLGTRYFDLEHEEEIMSASYSPNGNLVAASNGSCTLYLWEINTREKIAQNDLCSHTDLNSLGWLFYAPNGKLIVTEYFGGEGKSYFVNGTNGSINRPIEGYVSALTHIGFNSDGNYMITGGSKNTAQIREVSNGEIIVELIGHTNKVTEGEFSPDDTIIATSSLDETAIIWDSKTGSIVTKLIGHTDTVNSVSFAPDGTRVVTSSYDGTARVWDITNGDEILSLYPIGRENGRGVNAIYSPNGEYIVTGDWFTGIIKVWNASNGTVVQSFRHEPRYLQDLEFSPDGRSIISVSSNIIRIWEFDPK